MHALGERSFLNGRRDSKPQAQASQSAVGLLAAESHNRRSRSSLASFFRLVFDCVSS